jgi:hypothetical protein
MQMREPRGPVAAERTAETTDVRGIEIRLRRGPFEHRDELTIGIDDAFDG